MLADISTDKLKTKELFNAKTYAGLLVNLAKLWNFMFEESPTKYILRDTEQVIKVIEQKKALKQEIAELNGLTYDSYTDRFADRSTA